MLHSVTMATIKVVSQRIETIYRKEVQQDAGSWTRNIEFSEMLFNQVEPANE